MPNDTDSTIQAYLTDLGQRIRGLRAARGMTRRQLSEHADISERYLAQLEVGRANPSVVLLARVAAALNVDFHHLVVQHTNAVEADPELLSLLQRLSEADRRAAHELLEERFGDKRESRPRGVGLIGLRGAGKTTLGRALAARLGLPFVRLTERIEALGGMQIGELISLGGQHAFRRLERQALEDVTGAGECIVLEVGGSLVSEPATFSLLRSRFCTIWLRAAPQEHMQRVIHQGDIRPMEGDNSQAMADLQRILSEREVEYRKADFSLDTSHRTVDESLAELVRIATGALSIDAREISA